MQSTQPLDTPDLFPSQTHSVTPLGPDPLALPSFNRVSSSFVSPLALPDIRINSVSQAEGNSGTTLYRFTVSLSVATSQVVSVNFSTANGTATAGSDYTPISGTLTFAPTVTSRTITVAVNGDRTFEPNETFQVLLSNPINATLAGNTGTGTLINDDPLPTLSIRNVTQNEGNRGVSNFTFLVSLSNPSSQTVITRYSTADGSATISDNDYFSANGSLTFAPGETVKTITINVNRDLKIEPNETFGVVLTNPINAVLGAATATGTILNDDAPTGLDFNQDGNPDLLWRNRADGKNAIWQMNRTALSTAVFLPRVADPDWQIEGTADFNRDRDPDILWHNAETGQTVIWQMDGLSLQTSIALPTVTDRNWSIVDIADFNADGNPDILWRHGRDGRNAVWLLNGPSLGSVVFLPTVADLNWSIAEIADFDADGDPDILWRNRRNGQNAIWFMNRTTQSLATFLPTVPDLNWAIAAVNDFDGDGKPDILWRNASTGQTAIWQMNGALLSTVIFLPTVADPNWVIARTGDYTGDGYTDILWRNYASGLNGLWQMNGTQVSTATFLPPVADINWRIPTI